jgi:hypothetical protein
MSRPTGSAAFAAVAKRWPDVPPRAAFQALLTAHRGNVSRAARDIGVDRRVLLAAVDTLDLRDWLAEQWPDREAGGAPGA